MGQFSEFNLEVICHPQEAINLFNQNNFKKNKKNKVFLFINIGRLYLFECWQNL